MRRWTVTVLAAVAGLFVFQAQAADFEIGELTIEAPWARASVGAGRTGAAYLVVVNRGTAVDRLVAVATPVAARARIHGTTMNDGIMTMRPVEAVEIHPGEPSVLAPGGLHVMLTGLKAPLKKGETFPLTLTFERAGRIEIEVRVEAPGAMGPGHGHDEPGPGGKSS